MIFRQDLERLLRHWKKEKRDYFARLANLEGRIQTLAEKKETDTEEFVTLANQYQVTKDTAAVAHGYVNCLEYLIEEIDMEEHEIELTNPFEQIKLNVSITPTGDGNGEEEEGKKIPS